ncbi:glyoxal oxidase N-terminus-domain-containing protein [Mucor mucedo]|uniref:glyoxal oxidase N-terminus-domain-containing protein n=1 Tax=Mucor mucedo TaxID=29922 RepID=UPI0022203103|nr:glyoxal oxidase N-terminus-domain-containing protein [Mucor mucedo]XP_051460991.1 glyoxal oxidase N-terminus-domain-containing protein [Mucor mucedo]KAI7887683.1 glyoxal oxidase N-terminus-domain-containing protein [Mucor mucedo]KAI7894576.1 glyoxal oxidase N-terminus-domain-containing protein [Mucor mucedo]
MIIIQIGYTFLSLVSIVGAVSYFLGSVTAQNNESPFHWSDSQNVISPFAKSGKMEAIGRTGVAAMHAVLLNEKTILIIDKAEWNEAQFDSGQSAFHTGGGEKRGRDWKAEPGWQSIRHFTPCTDNSCLWDEYKTGKMTANRWYPTVEQLPEGDLFIIGGSTKGTAVNRAEVNVPSYEFWPPRPEGEVPFKFLIETMPYNLYPFVFVLPDGTSKIPGNPRSYPLTGGAIMLPLDPKNNYNVEILICGGSERMKRDATADDTCGRINLGDANPQWKMESFIHKRLMPDGVIMADGNVLWVNGCQRAPINKRWTQNLANTDIARMYHSVALTLPDGRVWIAGSNNVDPPDINAEYPTEFRSFDILLNLENLAAKDTDPASKIRVGLLRTGFSTHSMHMSQRYVFLNHEPQNYCSPHAAIYPPGAGMLYVLYDGVPSNGTEIFIERISPIYKFNTI